MQALKTDGLRKHTLHAYGFATIFEEEGRLRKAEFLMQRARGNVVCVNFDDAARKPVR